MKGSIFVIMIAGFLACSRSKTERNVGDRCEPKILRKELLSFILNQPSVSVYTKNYVSGRKPRLLHVYLYSEFDTPVEEIPCTGCRIHYMSNGTVRYSEEQPALAVKVAAVQDSSVTVKLTFKAEGMEGEGILRRYGCHWRGDIDVWEY